MATIRRYDLKVLDLPVVVTVQIRQGRRPGRLMESVVSASGSFDDEIGICDFGHWLGYFPAIPEDLVALLHLVQPVLDIST